MAFSDDLAKVHDWVVNRPKSVYFLLMGFLFNCLVVGIAACIVREPIYGNRFLWSLDVAVLTAFALSHAVYVLRRRGQDKVQQSPDADSP